MKQLTSKDVAKTLMSRTLQAPIQYMGKQLAAGIANQHMAELPQLPFIIALGRTSFTRVQYNPNQEIQTLKPLGIGGGY